MLEGCLAVLRKDETSAKQIKRTTPIRQLRAVASVDVNDPCVQQRALIDAAEALAELWKVSSPKRVLLANRVK